MTDADSPVAVDSEDVEVGDLVVTMTEPGHFRVVATNPPNVTLEALDGTRHTVREVGVRKIDNAPPVQRT